MGLSMAVMGWNYMKAIGEAFGKVYFYMGSSSQL